MIDAKTPRSPGWWLVKGVRKLNARLPRIDKQFRYHEGDADLPTQVEAARGAFTAFQKKSRTNYPEVIVGSCSERLTLRSMRTTINDDLLDNPAWGIWQGNDMDVEFAEIVQNALIAGDAYAIVGRGDGGRARITAEDPRQVVTIHDPVQQRRVRSAVKVYHDPDLERDIIHVFLSGEDVADVPGLEVPEGEEGQARQWVAYRDRKTPLTGAGRFVFSAGTFSWDLDHGGQAGEALGGPKVPVRRLRNRNGVGEFERHLDLIDRINHGTFVRMVIALYQAYRQRILFTDGDDGGPASDGDLGSLDDVLTADPGAWLQFPADAKVTELTQADMQGILSSKQDDIKELAAVTRTPLPAIMPDAANQSSLGAGSAREQTVFKIEDRQRRAAAFVRDVLEVALEIEKPGETFDPTRFIVDWYPVERYSLAEKFDALSKSERVPDEIAWRDTLQKSETEVAEMARLRDAKVLADEAKARAQQRALMQDQAAATAAAGAGAAGGSSATGGGVRGGGGGAAGQPAGSGGRAVDGARVVAGR